MDNRPVVKALLAHARTMEDWVRPIENTKKFRPSAANAFLLGVMFDRSVKADRAWEAARWINDSFGAPTTVRSLWDELSTVESRRLIGFLRYGNGGRALHRHYKTFARQLPEAARLLIKKYDGDPRRIWNNKRDVAEVRKRLEEIPGIGPALSRMAVLILARNYGLLGGKAALSQLDIKPDIHVMRVFKRCGFLSHTAKPNDAVVVAQHLYPKFPGALDAPAFNIGINWCRPSKPKCTECPIVIACPRKVRKISY